MAELIYSKAFGAGEEIFRIGDRGHNAYFIEKGGVEVLIPGENGQEIRVATMGAGEIFGEMSMIDDAPRSATIRTLAPTELIVIQRSQFIRPLEANNPMMSLILRILTARFRDARQQTNSDLGDGDGELEQSLEELRVLAYERISIEKDMRHGLETGEFQMHYQPITDLESGEIAGFEALMRWIKADGTFVSPVEFIPLAEETGLIVELGRMALETGLRDHADFLAARPDGYAANPAPFMSVNLSGLQILELDEIGRLENIINQSGIDPSLIKLEITESLMVENFEHACTALGQLKDLGLFIAIDDFGTGFSSLSYLHQLPLDTLKIDRAFVIQMDQSEKGLRVVQSIAQLSTALGLSIVAEGIEEKEQMSALKEMGCHFGQGYHMSKPLPRDGALELMQTGPVW